MLGHVKNRNMFAVFEAILATSLQQVEGCKIEG